MKRGKGGNLWAQQYYLSRIDSYSNRKIASYCNCKYAARAPKVCHPLLPPAWRSHDRAISPAFERDGIKYRLDDKTWNNKRQLQLAFFKTMTSDSWKKKTFWDVVILSQAVCQYCEMLSILLRHIFITLSNSWYFLTRKLLLSWQKIVFKLNSYTSRGCLKFATFPKAFVFKAFSEEYCLKLLIHNVCLIWEEPFKGALLLTDHPHPLKTPHPMTPSVHPANSCCFACSNIFTIAHI